MGRAMFYKGKDGSINRVRNLMRLDENGNLIRVRAAYTKVNWNDVLIERGYQPSPFDLNDYPNQCVVSYQDASFILAAKENIIMDENTTKTVSGQLHASEWVNNLWADVKIFDSSVVVLILSNVDIYLAQNPETKVIQSSCLKRINT